MPTPHQEAARKLWSDPAFREKIKAGIRNAWQNGSYAHQAAEKRERREKREQAEAAVNLKEQERRRAILADYQNRVPPMEILEKYHIGRATLYRRLRLAGIPVSYAKSRPPPKRQRNKGPRFSIEIKQRVVQRYQNGETVRQIAATEKPNKVTINRWINKAGLARRTRKGKYRIANREAAD